MSLNMLAIGALTSFCLAEVKRKMVELPEIE